MLNIGLQFFAHKKGVGSTRNGRDSKAKRLGVKRGDGQFVLAGNVLAGTDRMEIYLSASPDGSQMLLISLFDNLGKGSSGAAIQCMNLMLGMEETAGLE